MNTLVVRPARIRTAGVRQQILLTAQQRLMILMLLFMAAFCLVSVRLLYFALFDTSAGHGSGAVAFVPARADIVDRKGIPLARTIDRSEEHTSELQSLMRISYAVFCLKTTTIHNEITHTPPNYTT